jgi:copper chaperone NosL
MRAIIGGMLLALLTACSHSPQPVDIDSSDMCGYCRMAISQKQFAAEALDVDGNAIKFDDIGCMRRFLAAAEGKHPVRFVMDYGERRWLDADTAFFVRGSRIPTPMGGGILAFGRRSRAEAEARESGGEVLPFAALFKR